MRYGYWLPVFGGWLRNVEDEGMEASWDYVSRLAQRSEQIGYDLTLIAVGAAFVVIQAVVGLASHSTTVYLAQPVVLSALWGVVFFVSIAIGRPLIGVFASVWYPFPAWFRASEPYRREFGMQSFVWGLVCLARAGLRMWALLDSGVGGFVVVSIVTGTPLLAALVAWGIWHARRTFLRLDEPAPERESSSYG